MFLCLLEYIQQTICLAVYVFKHSLQPIQQTIRTAVYVPDMPALTSPASYPDIAASEPYICLLYTSDAADEQ